MKIKKAAEYMLEIGANFLFTGEVLGQRPMSQHRRALELIDRESGVADLILRPLSAKTLKPTACERNGWVDRNALLAITGRSRKTQITLANNHGINEYRCPAGGCLLTDTNFAARLRTYLESVKPPVIADMALLKMRRHVHLPNGDWIIIARNETEGERLEQLAPPNATLLVPTNFSAPVVLLRGTDRKTAIDIMRFNSHRAIPEDAVIMQRQGSKEILLQKSAWNEILVQTREES
jgi:tRNA U34 2-thiouridine synthase MnmA/TrmU